MNKIKVLYDVAKVMREKDAFNGVIEVKASKDDVEIFYLNNEFSKDMAGGLTKAKITTVVDHDGKQLRHESTTEFSHQKHNEEGPWGCHNHRHFPMHKDHDHFHMHHAGMRGCGLKGRLDHLLAVLNALNNVKIMEQEDKSLLLSLDLTDIPDDLKQNIQQRVMERHHDHFGMKGFRSIEKGNLECRINKNNEVESIKLNLDGKLCENDEDHAVVCAAAVSFAW